MITSHLTASQLELCNLQIPTTMSNSQSLNTSLLEFMMSPKNERVFIHDLSDLGLQVMFDTWWAPLNVGMESPIVWKNSRLVPSRRFYLHCGIEETGYPGIICIICLPLPRQPSEHVTSSMGKHWLAKAHNAKLNELTELEVSELTSITFDGTALAILKRQGSRGITIASLQSRFIFVSYIVSILMQMVDTTVQTGSNGLPNCRISQRNLESLSHDGMCFGW